jgi:hypothetical protein
VNVKMQAAVHSPKSPCTIWSGDGIRATGLGGSGSARSTVRSLAASNSARWTQQDTAMFNQETISTQKNVAEKNVPGTSNAIQGNHGRLA